MELSGKKRPEPGDPMVLHGVAVGGDPAAMAAALIEEYAGLGWGREAIRRIFHSPAYRASRLRAILGDARIEALITRVLGGTGALRVRVQFDRDEREGGEGWRA